jgi:hypothetical protein
MLNNVLPTRQSGKPRLPRKTSTLLLAVIFFLLYSLNGKTEAQIFVKLNYDFYNMSDLKDLQSEFLSDLTIQGIDAQITESYPAHLGFQIGLLFLLNPSGDRDLWLGGSYDYATTGGRVHYSDYSGEVKVDQVANAYTVSGIISLSASHHEFLKLNVSLSAGLIFSDLDTELLIRIGDEEQKETLSFSSLSFGLEPAITPSIVLSNFNLGLSISYLVSIPSSLEYNRNRNAYLINKNGDKVSIDWSGVKLGLLIMYTF